MDLGTGDGRAVLARAAAKPDTLVVGLDASASAMADASRRASRARLSNAIFVAADALSLPDALASFADELTVTLPWGSLLHAATAADPRLIRLLKPGGRLELLLSASAADQATGLANLDPRSLAAAYRAAGVVDVRVRPATIDDVRGAGSSWGKRLLQGGRGGRDRQLWLLSAASHAGYARATQPSPASTIRPTMAHTATDGATASASCPASTVETAIMRVTKP
jgi:16S rRNA (adenine(1408)-N(1))-methyltransferase